MSVVPCESRRLISWSYSDGETGLGVSRGQVGGLNH